MNLHYERWRSDLEQSAVIFSPVNSNSVLEVIPAMGARGVKISSLSLYFRYTH
jgi:hypothetical protein